MTTCFILFNLSPKGGRLIGKFYTKRGATKIKRRPSGRRFGTNGLFLEHPLDLFFQWTLGGRRIGLHQLRFR
ncbi:MAG: hypothetical protein K2X55_16235, partial [Burkholderiaceae bacterium]|nr:hypothetical protein [Burkholderiaceae bacterium]